MSAELGIIFGILGAIGTLSAVIFAIINFTGSRSRMVRDDTREDAEQRQQMAISIATISTKLDVMLTAINDVKRELTNHSAELNRHKQYTADEFKRVDKDISELKLALRIRPTIDDEEENQ